MSFFKNMCYSVLIFCSIVVFFLGCGRSAKSTSSDSDTLLPPRDTSDIDSDTFADVDPDSFELINSDLDVKDDDLSIVALEEVDICENKYVLSHSYSPPYQTLFLELNLPSHCLKRYHYSVTALDFVDENVSYIKNEHGDVIEIFTLFSSDYQDSRRDRLFYDESGRLASWFVDIEWREGLDHIVTYEYGEDGSISLILLDYHGGDMGAASTFSDEKSFLYYHDGVMVRREDDVNVNGDINAFSFYSYEGQNPLAVTEEKDLDADGVIDQHAVILYDDKNNLIGGTLDSDNDGNLESSGSFEYDCTFDGEEYVVERASRHVPGPVEVSYRRWHYDIWGRLLLEESFNHEEGRYQPFVEYFYDCPP